MRTPSAAATVLVASGAAGAVLGYLHADWQWAVEHAQVLAGFVTYGSDAPVGIAHAAMWSLVPQVCALFLQAGVSEIALSKILSAVIGAVSCQALASVVFALSRDARVALAAVFVILVSRITDYGVSYAVLLMGTAHTYGALGLSLATLTVGLLGMGWYRAGAFLLALLPAVHGAFGVWTLAVVGVALIAERRASVVRAWPAFAGGALAAVISFAIYRATAPDVPAISSQEASRYLRAFIAIWDAHRAPVNFDSNGVKLTAGVLALAAVWLVLQGRRLEPSVRLFLRISVVGAAVALGLALWTRFGLATMPDVLVVLMPGRFLNASIMTASAVLIGLTAAVATSRWSRIWTVGFLVALLGSSRSTIWDWAGVRLWRLDPLAVLSIAAVVLAIVAWRSRGSGPPSCERPGAVWALGLSMVTLVGAAAAGRSAIHARRAHEAIFQDRTNHPLLEAASRTDGLLLTGADHFLVQLRTRRPVLLDGGTLDTLPYAPASGPSVERILRDVYGIDLFDPPAEARGGGRIPPIANRDVWQLYSRDRWRQIKRDYGVTLVLTPGNWILDLPHLSRGRDVELYAIPD